MSTFDEPLSSLHMASPREVAPAETDDPELVSYASVDTSVRPRPANQVRNQGKALVWEVAQTVLLTIAIFLAVRLVIQNFRVEGASMDPTLHSGQFLLVDKVSYLSADGTPFQGFFAPKSSRSSIRYLFDGPSRGDIIVFQSPGAPDKDFIKRVIGMPGETVKVQDGKVYINGALMDEPYITHKATYDVDSKRIPSDSYFVLGDNRPNSSDSHLGWFVKADTIIGRAWVSYWPPSLWAVLQPAAYANVDSR